MRELLQDLRFAARLLRRSPAFTIVAVAALALGIGANAAIFSVVNALLLEPLPYNDPSRLVVVWEYNVPREKKDNVVSPGNYLHWREMNHSFEDMAGVVITSTTLSGSGEPEQLSVQYATASLFPMIGVPPQRGRWFTGADEAPNVNVAILSDGLWRRRFGGDPGVINRAITLDGQTYTVVGVMPPGYSVFSTAVGAARPRVDVWEPLGFTAASRTPRGRWLTVIARLRPGVTIEQAQNDMRGVHAELGRMFPAFNTGWTARVVPLQAQLTGGIRPALLVMTGAVAFVLLIACANVANLLLARGTVRRREFALRAALGADRRRLVRQLLAESALLAAAGAVTGVALAWWGVRLLRGAITERLSSPGVAAIAIDGRVLLFACAAAAAGAFVFGLLPALSFSGRHLTDSLKDGGRASTSGGAARMRSVLVVVEFALALVLLVGAGLLIRSFAALLAVDRGFDPTHTVTAAVSIPSAKYTDQAHLRAFFDDLFQRIDTLPGVRAAGGTSFLPLNGVGAATGFTIVGRPEPPAGDEPVTDVRVVTHDYFDALGIPLLRGRRFDARENGTGVRRVIINDALARTYFPGEDPIGRQIVVSWNDKGPDEIVGVVADVRQESLETAPRACIYWPPSRFAYPFMTIAVRTAGDPGAIVPALASALHAIDPSVALANVRTMDEVVSRSVAERRLTMALLAAFAVLALVLAAIGIYGVIAYSVAQRTQEIGIRMALGALPGAVLAMVLRQALLLAAAGIALGAAGAWIITRLMQQLLFGVTPTDAPTFSVVAAGLTAVALVAAAVPGRRATRVDPLTALRAE